MPGLSRSPLLFGFSRSACAGSRLARADLVRRDFTSPVPTYKLIGDITYLRTAAHGKAHMKAGEGSGHHSEVRRTTTGYNTVSHPEEGRWETKVIGGHRE